MTEVDERQAIGFAKIVSDGLRERVRKPGLMFVPDESKPNLTGVRAFELTLYAALDRAEELGVEARRSTLLRDKIMELEQTIAALTAENLRMQRERDKASDELKGVRERVSESIPALRDLLSGAESAGLLLERYGCGKRVYRAESNNEHLCLIDAIKQAKTVVDLLDPDAIPF